MGRISSRRSARWAALVFTLAALAGGTLPASAHHVTGGGQSFTFLHAGFTQDIFGVSPHFMGGVAFAPDEDPWVDDCSFGGSHLHRYDAQSSPAPVNGTFLHSESTADSNAGCGLTNHSNGDMYTNTSPGVVRLNASTGAQIGAPFGPTGNALGIAEDPDTGNLIYVGTDGTLHFVNPALTASGTFSTVTTGSFPDGIAFDPTGDFLLVANRPSLLTIVDGDTGTLIQHIPVTSEPDGISFHATAPKFVVTNNTDGTMTRFDFPGDNYAAPPSATPFASGGFRGDLTQVGADGCIYVTQAGTRYNDGTITGENSLVRICGGFAPGPGVSSITLTPADDTNPAGTSHTVTGHVTRDGAPLAGQTVTFTVTGQNAGATGTCVPAGCVTDSNGDVTFTYVGSNGAGDDTITASFTDSTGRLQSATAEKHWTAVGPPPNQPGCKVTYGGWIIADNGDRANFGGNAKGQGPKGNQNYQDMGSATDIHVKSINVLSVTCSTDGTMASIFGKAMIDGAGSFDYQIDVTDPAAPGSSDTYRIRLSNGYDSGERPLLGGNVQIH